MKHRTASPVRNLDRLARHVRLLAPLLIVVVPLALAEVAHALAGGATGSGGGGGGGGGFSGGGSSFGGSRSSGSGGDDPIALAIGIGAVLLFFSLTTLWTLANKKRREWIKRKIFRRAREVEAAAGAAHLDDGYWDPAMLKDRVREAFFPIQLSWENRDVSASRPYVSDALYERHKLQLEGLEAQHRVNRIKDLRLHDVQLVRIHNVTDDGEDRFVAYIECSARDWMEDTRTGAVINGNKAGKTRFRQYWSFARHPEHGWVLDEIQQGEEGAYHLDADIVNEDEGPGIHERDGEPVVPGGDPMAAEREAAARAVADKGAAAGNGAAADDGAPAGDGTPAGTR